MEAWLYIFGETLQQFKNLSRSISPGSPALSMEIHKQTEMLWWFTADCSHKGRGVKGSWLKEGGELHLIKVKARMGQNPSKS